jgi:hypothetical protein
MKKLSIAIAILSLSIAAPVFACPSHDDAPRTADKADAAKGAKTADKAKDAKPAKTADKAKPADKVSQK